MSRHLKAVLLLSATVLFLSASGAVALRTDGSASLDSYKVILAQVVHRHGARTPTNLDASSATDAAVCGSIGCGQLTYNGEDMLQQLGAWARARYMGGSGMTIPTTIPTAEEEGATIPTSSSFSSSSSSSFSVNTIYIANSTYYSPKQIYQRSTDVSRTLQSAAAFVQGLFNGSRSSRFPVIANMPLAEDSLLYVKSIPSFTIYKTVEKKKLHEANAVHVFNALNQSVWVAMGAELMLGEKCDEASSTLSKCTHEIYDVCEAYFSEGILSQEKYPLAYKYWHSGLLAKVKGWWHFDLYSTNWDDHTDAHRGPLGRNVVGELVTQMQAKVQEVKDGNAASSSSASASKKKLPLLREYSAHDTTMVVLSGFFRHTWSMRNPPFAEAFWFELLQKDGTEGVDSSDYHVRVVHGYPNQAPGNHSYTQNMRFFNLTCKHSGGSGEVYSTGTGDQLGCPLDDFVAYYNYYTGSSSKGLNCYVHKKHLEAKEMDCTVTGSSAPKEKLCVWYRASCPQYACPSGSYLEFPLLNCKVFPSSSSSSTSL